MELNVSEIIGTIVTVLIIPALAYIGTQISVLLKEKIKDDKLEKYLAIANDCVLDAVLDVAQTFVDRLEEDGWNEDTKKQAFIMAKERALAHLGITGRTIIEEALGDFDGWINSKIESKVKANTFHTAYASELPYDYTQAIGFRYEEGINESDNQEIFDE